MQRAALLASIALQRRRLRPTHARTPFPITCSFMRREVALNHYGDCRLLQAEAQIRIDELETVQNEFWSTKPFDYRRVIDTSGNCIHSMRIAQSIPTRASVLTSDVIEKMRHSLDHAVTATVARKFGIVSKGVFPFGKSEKGFNKNCKTKNMKDIDKSIIDIAKSYMPYLGGNDLMYALTASNKTKHRQLIGVSMSVAPEFTYFDASYKSDEDWVKLIISTKDSPPSIDEVVVGISSPGTEAILTKCGVHMKFVFLDSEPGLANLVVVDTLREILQLTESILAELEAL